MSDKLRRKIGAPNGDIDSLSLQALPIDPGGEAAKPRRSPAQRSMPLRRISLEPSIFYQQEQPGDRNLGVELFTEAMQGFSRLWSQELLSSEPAFQDALRWFSAMYFFLGGQQFQKDLARHVDVSEGTVSRWINGQSAPVDRIRFKALGAAEGMLKHVSETRRGGANLWDVVKHSRSAP